MPLFTPAATSSSGALTAVETLTAPSGGSASFDFQSIPQTGKALLIDLLIAGEVAATNTALNVRFNNDSGSNYDHERLDGQNTTVVGGAVAGGTSALVAEIPGASITPRACSVTIRVPGYATTTLDKAFTSVGGYSLSTAQADQGVRTIHGTWRSTAAISRVTLTPASGDIAEGSTATLYTLG